MSILHRESRSRSTFISNSISLRLWIIIDSAATIGYLSSGLNCKKRRDKKRDAIHYYWNWVYVRKEMEKIEGA